MFLRCQRRKKDGKVHEYWSIVESRRLGDGRVAQRQVLYLGEINASQREAWRKTIEVQDAGQRRQVALFPAGSMPCDDVDVVGVCLSRLRLERPRQWGACWLALQLWQQLELDSFWRSRLRPSREGTPRLKVLKTLVAYRLIDPGSEWRLHRQWFDASAMADLLESDFALAEKNTLYRCLDKLVEHKDALNQFLVRRWGELFGAKFDVLLYDLTSTYFETDEDRGPNDLRQYGYSRDKRGDCRQVVIALIVTPEGFPLSYEVMHPHRGQPGQDAQHRRELLGGHAQGTAEQAGAVLPHPTVGEGARWRAGQATVHRRRRVRTGQERCAHRQGARHARQAAAPLHRQAQGHPGPVPDARPVVDEAGRGQARRRARGQPGQGLDPEGGQHHGEPGVRTGPR
jgi:hypothetical protein